MALINVSDLTFAYDGSFDNVFEEVSFQIDTNWKLGFTGRNGRGKTTFLNLLMGKYEYSGVISSPVEFMYFPFEVEDEAKSVHDIVSGYAPNAQLWEIERELSLLEVHESVLARAFDTLSNGERTKVLLAALFLRDDGFLLIDEPTNHLDVNARRTVSKYLNSKKGFILVSHDRDFMDNCIDHIMAINRADIEIRNGNFSSWRENKERTDNFELAQNERIQKDVKKLSAAAKRTSAWADKVEKSKHAPQKSGLSADTGYIGHKAAKMMKRSKAIEKRQSSMMEEKSKLLKNIETADSLSISPIDYHANRLLELRNVSIHYDGRAVCEDINLTINRGDRISLSGKNGSGKSSVLKLINNESIAFDGEVNIGSGLRVSYVPQDTSFLEGGLREFARDNGIDESLFKAILRKLDFSREQFDKDISEFSGGQKKKVLIARSLCQKAHLYIWDEPLNFIDVLSRIQIEELLLKHRPTMLFVEHDAAFAHKIATHDVML